MAVVIWEGNRRLYFRLPRREDWLLRPWRRLGLLLMAIGLYTIPVATTLLWLWRDVTGDTALLVDLRSMPIEPGPAEDCPKLFGNQCC